MKLLIVFSEQNDHGRQRDEIHNYLLIDLSAAAATRKSLLGDNVGVAGARSQRIAQGDIIRFGRSTTRK